MAIYSNILQNEWVVSAEFTAQKSLRMTYTTTPKPLSRWHKLETYVVEKVVFIHIALRPHHRTSEHQ